MHTVFAESKMNTINEIFVVAGAKAAERFALGGGHAPS